MLITGIIAETGRSHLPRTWDALEVPLGAPQLRFLVDAIKYRLFNTVVDPLVEITTYNPSEIMLAAKLVALQMITPGIDYWGRQLMSEILTGSNEQKTFADTRTGLYKLQTRLLAEIPELETEVGIKPRKRGRGVAVSPGGFVTSDPLTFPGYNEDRYGLGWPYPFKAVTP